MKKINLNRSNLDSKKLVLMKEKVANLSTNEMLNVLGGGYISEVVRCGGSAPGGCSDPTTILASCSCTTGC